MSLPKGSKKHHSPTDANRSAYSSPVLRPKYIPLLMIQLVHDLTLPKLRNHGSVVYIYIYISGDVGSLA